MTATWFGTVSVERGSPTPLRVQLYAHFRDAILSGRLRPATRLPSTRALATELGVGRNTVVAVFAQLEAEGYLTSRVGSGTVVRAALPDELLGARRPAPRAPAARAAASTLSRRGEALARVRRPSGASARERAFAVGLPAVDQFPKAIWARLLARRARQAPSHALGYGHEAGLPSLREAIAAYVGPARGVACRPEQVVVVAGAQAALDLACRLLLDPGDEAWIEDPGYLGARGALLAANARLVAVPVDAAGLDVDSGERLAPKARLAYASPSFQFPTGATLTLSRRLALLDWAARSDSWILEDDYDGEYRYVGRPLSAMQGIDAAERVVYVGTFSKTMFPALRVGYLIVPQPLAAAFAIAIRHTGHVVPAVVQAALADFVTEGHFARHVARMRSLYAERQARLVAAASRRLRGLLALGPAEAGMHLVGDLDGGRDDVALARALEPGVTALPLSTHYLGEPRRRGLLLGYAGATESEIDRGVRRLAAALGAGGDGEPDPKGPGGARHLRATTAGARSRAFARRTFSDRG